MAVDLFASAAVASLSLLNIRDDAGDDGAWKSVTAFFTPTWQNELAAVLVNAMARLVIYLPLRIVFSACWAGF
jgi:hypothetical protein